MDNTEINEIIAKWTNPEEIRLRAGEIDPDTMLTVLAVMNAFGREVADEINRLERVKIENDERRRLLSVW